MPNPPPENRNLGEQPLAELMDQTGLTRHDLVAASELPLTHKAVARACKGRWLTLSTRERVLKALNRASGKTFTLSDLFNYQD